MSHLARLYRFSVRPVRRKNEPRLLGDFDHAGSSFLESAPGILKQVRFTEEIEGLNEEQPVVAFKSMVEGLPVDRMAFVFSHHEYGVRGLLNLRDTGTGIPFGEADDQEVDSVLAVIAPAAQKHGLLGIHIPSRRSIKVGLEKELKRILKEQYGLTLDLTPVVPIEALERAISRGVGSVTFRRLNNPSGIFREEDRVWADADALGKAAITLTPQRRALLSGRKIISYLRTRSQSLDAGEQPVNFAELATIQGSTYDELSVEVTIDGRPRTLRIDGSGSSMAQAFSWELDTAAGTEPPQLSASLIEIMASHVTGAP